MNRRELFAVLAGAPLAVAGASKIRDTKFGRLTVEGHRAHRATTGEDLHVYFNGRDVTRSCFEADDRAGYVKLFCRDRVSHEDWTAQGAIHIGPGGGACRVFLRGDVVISPGEKL